MTATSALADHLVIRASPRDWFRWAVSRPKQSRWIAVEECSIHYLLWPAEVETAIGRGLLFVHGGGAHAYWSSFIAPQLASIVTGPVPAITIALFAFHASGYATATDLGLCAIISVTSACLAIDSVCASVAIAEPAGAAGKQYRQTV